MNPEAGVATPAKVSSSQEEALNFWDWKVTIVHVFHQCCSQNVERGVGGRSQGSTGKTEYSPTGALRLNLDVWPVAAGETDMNPEGGFCGMPTQFLGPMF